MIKSMTGFGSKEAKIAPIGKICVELRSINHKFQETVLHLPQGLLSLEDKIKKEIESKIKRGRVTCAIDIIGKEAPVVSINRALLKEYLLKLKQVKEEFQIKDEVSINTLVNLPGILSLGQDRLLPSGIWPVLKASLLAALDELIKARQKEGGALCNYLKNRADLLRADLDNIEIRFKKAIKDNLSKMKTDEERSSFLRNAEISEEIERLAFHARNFKNKLLKNGPIGKELDFIAQEMQREANTLAAKSFDTIISARVVQIKSQIEKIREQVQNVE